MRSPSGGPCPNLPPVAADPVGASGGVGRDAMAAAAGGGGALGRERGRRGGEAAAPGEDGAGGKGGVAVGENEVGRCQARVGVR
jgi:hypothetical protein